MSPLYVLIRSLARRLGVTKVLSLIRAPREYEDRFATCLFDHVHIDDVVWDVGANVGFYTVKLASRVGPKGEVVAFEPSPASVQVLRNSVEASEAKNIKILNTALGSRSGVATFQLCADPTSVENHVVNELQHDAVGAIEVPIYEGDKVVEAFQLRRPNIIKLDVEGHELECIKGMASTLAETDLRACFVEVHFAALEKQGNKYAPIEIEKLLRRAGFKSVRWIDSSHICATKELASIESR